MPHDPQSCVFCGIVSGHEPASIVCRDELVCAFMDKLPINPGHLLVVPNVHSVYLADVESDVGARMFVVAQRLAKAIRTCGVRCEGINFFLADGAAAGQEIFHAHLHVFPRFEGDGFGLRQPPNYFALPNRATLDSVAYSLRSALVHNHAA